MELITGRQARQIAENTINNIFVKNNVEYIIKKIMKKAVKGELHTYIYKAELAGNTNIEKITIEKIQILGYNVCVIDDKYKITW